MSVRKHMVSGSFSLPSRGSFHLSLTVLYSIGHMVVFSLMRWSSLLPSGFLVSRRTLDSCSPCSLFSRTGLLPCFAVLSNTILLTQTITLCKSLPDSYFYKPFGLVRFRSPLLSESLFAFFSSGYLDVSVPRVPLTYLYYSIRNNAILLALSSLIRISTAITFMCNLP